MNDTFNELIANCVKLMMMLLTAPIILPMLLIGLLGRWLIGDDRIDRWYHIGD